MYKMSEFPKCYQMECFANRNEGVCKILTSTSFPKRGGKAPGDCCPFFKTPDQIKEEAKRTGDSYTWL